MTIRQTGEDAYFAASNSAKGFYSYYPQCFDAARVGHVYAVKGGPGTGKSRFMRDVAEYAQHLGWRCEYIYCSSDPSSLDGVILTSVTEERCIALLDATAPHVYEPSRPGVREDIINLGMFWDIEILASRGEEIEALGRQKSAAYRQAYRYLAGAGEMCRTMDELAEPFIKREAIRRFAARLMRDIPREDSYRAMPALMRSLGMLGDVVMDTYFAKASHLCLIDDCHGTAQYLLSDIGELALEKRLSVRISHDPLLPERLDGIFLCGSKTAFAIAPKESCPYAHRVISMRRFVQTAKMKSVKKTLLYADRMRRAMLGGALETMDAVKKAHFQVEQLYISAMDFSAKEAFTADFCRRVFGGEDSALPG